jgi:hypothetical protein
MMRKQNTEPSVSMLAAQFRRLYGLFPYPIKHEAVHVATGFDVSLADELRVDVITYGLQGKPFEVAVASARDLYEGIQHALDGTGELVGVDLPSLACADFIRIQTNAEMLDPREIMAQYDLGLRIGAHIQHLTSCSYSGLKDSQMGRLPASSLDFVAHAHAIKQRYETPYNRAVAKRMARAFYEAACRDGRGDEVPAPGSPWHGARSPRYVDLILKQSPAAA